MYSIEKTNYGFHLIFSGPLTDREAGDWLREAEEKLVGQTPGFGVFIDVRTMRPQTPSAQDILTAGQLLYKAKGMIRSVVVVKSSLLRLQCKQNAMRTGIYKWERYIDASSEPDWEKIALDWVENAIDPDLVVTAGQC